MYNDLISGIQARLPGLSIEQITHWLHNQDFEYGIAQELIPVLQAHVQQFLNEHNLTFPEVLNEILFTPAEENFDFIDLFAGIGGFNLAMQAQGGRCVFSSEWDNSARKTYFNNYGKFPFGDINNFTGDIVTDDEIDQLIPDHQILCGGFPCQPFSLAGVSARTSRGQTHGFECETQGTLFYSIARVAFVKQPQVLFLENVKNITSHNNGETFRVIRETLENLAGDDPDKFNYVFKFRVINAQTVVPQKRVRCYMVCIREDVYDAMGDYELPEFPGEPLPLNQALEDLDVDEAEEYTISDRLWQGHINRTARNIERNTGFVANLANVDAPANTIVARYGKDGKECLIPQNGGRNPRKLTKTECARLFGYPPEFVLPEAKTPTYKLLGNSVVVPLVTAIAGTITEYMRG